MADSRSAQVVVLAIVLVVVVAGIASHEAGPPAEVQIAPESQVKILNWNWKKDVTGRIFAVFGKVENLTDGELKNVKLELRTEDAQKSVLARHLVPVGDMPPRSKRPFREDVPRTGKESMGYLEVKSVGP